MFAAIAERPAAKMRTRLKATRARFFNTPLGPCNTLQNAAIPGKCPGFIHEPADRERDLSRAWDGSQSDGGG